jgi:hypothetical protein
VALFEGASGLRGKFFDAELEHGQGQGVAKDPHFMGVKGDSL